MNRAEMLELLKEGDPIDISVLKWKDMLKARSFDEIKESMYSENCALCESTRNIYFRNLKVNETITGPINCYNCPIYDRTNMTGCMGTPFEDLVDLMAEIDSNEGEADFNESWPEIKSIIEKEIEILESLKNPE